MYVFTIDGSRFGSFREFARVLTAALLPDYEWNGNLDALNDILRGGFGTPDEGFVLRIVNVVAARDALGYAETAIWLEERLERCHPTNREYVKMRLAEARACRGTTLFDEIIAIIREHGPGGEEAEDNVILELESL